MTAPRFRQLPHTADVRLAVWGAGERELLANAVAGALRITLGRPAVGEPRRWLRLRRWPRELSARLVRVVNEALFLFYTRRELVVAVRCSRSGASLGVVPAAPGLTPVTEVKAATFHALRPPSSPRIAVVLTLDL